VREIADLLSRVELDKGLRHADQLGDGRVQCGEREELPVAQLGDDEASRNLNRNFDLGLGEGRRLQVMRVRPAKRCALRIPSIPFAVAHSS
jgi:hypothetical protein